MKHDFKAALEELNELPFGEATHHHIMGVVLKRHYATIIHALALADIVTGEPTEGMVNEVKNLYYIGDWIVGKIFKAMISEAVKLAEEKAGA